MALDAATLSLTGRELNARLKDARIDKIFEPTRDEVVLNLRTRTENFRLFLSARSGSARACITQETLEMCIRDRLSTVCRFYLHFTPPRSLQLLQPRHPPAAPSWKG